jgi:hypothetical protein
MSVGARAAAAVNAVLIAEEIVVAMSNEVTPEHRAGDLSGREVAVSGAA